MTLKLDARYGLALLNKPKGKTSFYLVSRLRRLLNVKCIGHAGTLDPFATGLMILLVGKPFTKLSNRFIALNKEYHAKVCLGKTTDSYDIDGKVTKTSDKKPTLEELQKALEQFQGQQEQIPPMFSAKKVQGKKLYELARKGIEIQREPKLVEIEVELLSFRYPHLELYVRCSSGTYIRSLAHDLGEVLGCGAHLEELKRTRIGNFSVEDAQDLSDLTEPEDLNLRKCF